MLESATNLRRRREDDEQQAARSHHVDLFSESFEFLAIINKLSKVFVDDVADVLQIDGEQNDFHCPTAFAIIEACVRYVT
jgi:hypothetical protein